MITENKKAGKNTDTFILGFQEIDRSKLMLAGGKGANLGELSLIGGIRVPEGFCVTTEAYRKITENNARLNSLLDELTHLKAEEREKISPLTAKIRMAIETVPINENIAKEIEGYLTKFGEKEAFAVRSSATAEDLPTASFAGQQDTYLNIIGKEAILKHISKCWASLFTDRAVIYRLQNGFDHLKVRLAVVVQQMVFSQAAGILFTADPVTGNRKVLSIDASFGLGEAMVSGLVNADSYKVGNGRIIDKNISAKKLGIYALKDGGTREREIEPGQQNRQALTDQQILELARIGTKTEGHFGSPQDIEWCLADETFYIVQSRPITTLFPIPEANDEENHVYISVGHQQMMTDPMKPLGLSLWQLRAARPMFKAAGRLFVDVADGLAKPAGREDLLEAMGQHDPLIKDALLTIIERGDFIEPLPDDEKRPVLAKSTKGMPSADILAQAGNDLAIVRDLIKDNETSVETLKQTIRTKSGPDLFDFILDDIEQSKKMIFDTKYMGVINIKNLEPGAGNRKFEQGLQEALKKEEELLDRLKQLPDGEQKATETKQMISLLRNFAGYREYPKYGIVNRFFVYKQALLKEVDQLVRANVIHKKEDSHYLTFEELREAVRANKLDYQVISKRKDEHKLYEKLTPPRVITSDGEIVAGKYKRENLPAGAIVGLPVSSGVIEGRARVILNMEDAELEEGDLLVTSFTDPSWTPLFVSIKGLVTEVGGLMTHGAVIAREYGLPAVVGVEDATKLIKNGQRIRVNGTDGYVEIL